MRKCLSGITILAALLAIIPLSQAQAAPTEAGASGGQSPVTQTATSASTTSTSMPALGAEVVSKRTETTKTFATSTPGLYVTKVYSQPVHYLDASGNWTDIDASLVSAGSGHFKTAGTKNAVQVATSFADPALGSLQLDASHSVAFGLSGAAAHGSATPNGNSITYSGILPNTDLTLQAANSQIKEDIVLQSPAAPSVYLFPLKLQGLTPSIAADGEVLFTDETGATRAIIPQGYMQDSADPVHHVGAVSQGVTYSLVGVGTPAVALKVTLDHAWLADPARVYPVTVDPTVSNFTTGEDDTYVMSNFTRDNAYDTILKVGTYDGGTHLGIAFMNFNLSSLNGMVINSATFFAYEDYAWSCSPRPMAPYQVTQGWSGHTMQSYPGATLGAKLGYNPSASFAMGYNSSCPANWAYWDVTNAVYNWTHNIWGQYGIAMKVDPGYETDDYSWKNFLSEDYCGSSGCAPVISVSWQSPTPPSAPTSVSAVASGSGQASISWNPPASNGGATVDQYVTYAFTSSGSYANLYSITCGTCTSATIGGLTPGTAYYFLVYAHNTAGWGSAGGQSNTITAITTPSAPPNPTAAVNGVGSAAVSWGAASNGYASVDDYIVYAYNASGSYAGVYSLVCGTCLSASLGGLALGSSYYFLVYAHNSVGWGPAAQTANLTAATTPGTPQNVAAAANGQGAATVVWSAPASNGYSPITSYSVAAYYNSNHAAAGISTSVCGTCTQATLTGMTAGTQYYFAVTAQNLAGSGPAANSASVTIASSSPPVSIFAPTNVVATAGNGQASLTWTAPALSLSGLTSYSVTTFRASDGTQLATMQAGTATNAVVTGLTNGVSVTFTVTGSLLGLTGTSPASNAVTPSGPPTAPTAVTATVADSQAVVSWSGANSNGSPITSYTVTAYTASNGSAVTSITAAASPATVRPLANGTSYYFTVHSTNANGSSPESPHSNTGTPAGLPLAPTNVSATPGDQQATVSWTAPSGNGSPLSSYVVAFYPSGQTATIVQAPATTATVIGLQNGSSYAFTVQAENAQGPGPMSTPSNQLVPSGIPYQVANLQVANGDAKALVSWSPPGALPNGTPGNNGSPVTGYSLTTSPTCSGCVQTLVTGTSSAQQILISGLTNGTTYTIAVTASNANGPGSATSVDAFPRLPANQFVGLGDSYSSGQGNPPFTSSSSCDVSQNSNYSMLAAQTLNLSGMNYACSGATAANVINTPQQVTYSGGGTSTVIPQIQNLTGYEDDIALTVGPDGLSCANYDCKFATVLKTCVSIPLIYSHTQPCQPDFDPTNDPEVTNAIARL